MVDTNFLFAWRVPPSSPHLAQPNFSYPLQTVELLYLKTPLALLTGRGPFPPPICSRLPHARPGPSSLPLWSAIPLVPSFFVSEMYLVPLHGCGTVPFPSIGFLSLQICFLHVCRCPSLKLHNFFSLFSSPPKFHRFIPTVNFLVGRFFFFRRLSQVPEFLEVPRFEFSFRGGVCIVCAFSDHPSFSGVTFLKHTFCLVSARGVLVPNCQLFRIGYSTSP